MKSCFFHRWARYNEGEKVLVPTLVWGREGANDKGVPETRVPLWLGLTLFLNSGDIRFVSKP